MWGMTLDLETPRMSGIGFVIWLHYNNKFIEFFESVELPALVALPQRIAHT